MKKGRCVADAARFAAEAFSFADAAPPSCSTLPESVTNFEVMAGVIFSSCHTFLFDGASDRPILSANKKLPKLRSRPLVWERCDVFSKRTDTKVGQVIG